MIEGLLGLAVRGGPTGINTYRYSWSVEVSKSFPTIGVPSRGESPDRLAAEPTKARDMRVWRERI